MQSAGSLSGPVPAPGTRRSAFPWGGKQAQLHALASVRRAVAALPRYLSGVRVVQLALIVDQSRRFTGAEPWLQAAVALPAIAVLSIPLLFRRAPLAAIAPTAWVPLVMAAVACYWPLDRWALGVLLASVLVAACSGWSFHPRILQRLSGLTAWISAARLTFAVWGIYLWCLVVQPPPVITMVAVGLLPLPCAVALSRWLVPAAAPARWATAGLLLLLIPALPGSVTAGRGIALGFYTLLGLVLVADVCAALATLSHRGVSQTGSVDLAGTSGRAQRAALAALLPGLLLAAGVRLAALYSTAMPVGSDQFQYYEFAQSISSTGVTTAPRPLYMLGATAFGVAPLSGVYLSFVQQLSGVPLFPSAAVAIVFAGVLQWLALVALVHDATRSLRLTAIAGFVWALVPVGLDMQTWFGLANAFGLALLLLLLQAVRRFWIEGRWRWLLATGVLSCSLLLAHPLTAVFATAGGGLLVVLLIVADLRSGKPIAGKLVRLVACSGLALAVASPDLYFRYLSRGELISASWQSYLASRPDAAYLGWVIGLPLALLGLAGVLIVLTSRQRALGRGLRPAFGLAVVSALLLFGWLFGVRFPYGRVPIFLAAGLAPFASVALWRWGGRRLDSALFGTALLLAPHAGRMIVGDRDFFRYPNGASVQALQWIGQNTPPDAVLMVQSCQFSAATYFARRPTLPAMLPTMLSSSSEYPATQAALRIFNASPGFEQDLRKYNVRTVLLDRGCKVEGSVQSESQLSHLEGLPEPFRPVFDNGEMLVLER